MKLFKSLAVVGALIGASTTAALPPSAFTSIEYHVNTTADALPYATKSLNNDFKSQFDFLTFEDGTSIKLVTYLDTPDRILKENELSIRVREHVTKPNKSKITIKLRGDNPEAFGNVKNYRKAEIDITGDRNAYSVSWDVPYSPADIDVKNVDIDAVFALIKKDKRTWGMLKDIYESHKADFKQTEVMRTHEWTAFSKDKRFASTEIDFQVWTPFYRKPRIYFSEFSFKGTDGQMAHLKALRDVLEAEVKERGLDEGAHVGSKTGATFKLSKGF